LKNILTINFGWKRN